MRRISVRSSRLLPCRKSRQSRSAPRRFTEARELPNPFCIPLGPDQGARMTRDASDKAGAPPSPLFPSPAAEEIIQRFTARWNDSETLEEANLLRLAILRDLMREFHRERSSLLST